MYDKSNSYPVFQVKAGLFINQMFTKGENRLYMNKQESDIMKILLQTPFINSGCWQKLPDIRWGW